MLTIPLSSHDASSFIFYLPKEGLIYKNHSPTIVAGHVLVTRMGFEPIIFALKGRRVRPIPLTRDIGDSSGN